MAGFEEQTRLPDAARHSAGAVAGASPPGDGSLLAHLHELARQGATGEFVSTGGAGQAHVYLQSGRIAWASDSTHRHAFTEHLKSHAHIDDEAIEAVVAECRRTNHPIGEALVQWHLATSEQVHAALRHQITLALELAAGNGDAHTAFVERSQFGKYDASLTYNVSELLGEEANEPLEVDHMTTMEKLKELQSIEGFSGAAVFTPTGEQLAILEGDAQRLKDVGVLANNVLLNAQKSSLEMGTGRGQQVHVEAEKAHILVRCLNEGTDPLKSQPGKAHIHLVMVLKSEASIGLAKMRINAAALKLAEDFRL